MKKAFAALHLTEQNNQKPNEQRSSVEEIAKILEINRATYYRYLDWAKNNVNDFKKRRYLKTS